MHLEAGLGRVAAGGHLASRSAIKSPKQCPSVLEAHSKQSVGAYDVQTLQVIVAKGAALHGQPTRFECDAAPSAIPPKGRVRVPCSAPNQGSSMPSKATISPGNNLRNSALCVYLHRTRKAPSWVPRWLAGFRT